MTDICIDARMAYASGIGTCIRQIVPLLNQPPFRVILLLNDKKPSWCDSFEQIILSSPIYSIQEQLELPLKIPKCDLFWSPHYNIPLLPIRAKKRAVTIHDACHLALSKHLSFAEKLYAKTMLKAAYRQSDLVFTDSTFSKNELEHYLGQSSTQINIVPMAVDHDYFKKAIDPYRIKDVQEKYGLPKNFILFVGNLKPHKNLQGLIKAFSLASLSNWSLVLVGKNKGLRNSISKIEENNIVVLENVSNEELPVLYSLASLFILPSFYEGFGLPPLEAMSCECPTLVSNAASLPEVCGDASLYFPPEDPQEMATMITRVLFDEELKKNLVMKGLERAKTFSWENTAMKYRQLFAKVL
jgi:glycosyltransferase involved in cell wall biosynthesis